MRMLGLMLLLVVLIITLTNIASLVGRTNGIPDVLQKFMPESAADKEERGALETLEAPFAQAENAAQVDDTYDPLAGSIVVSRDLTIPHRNEPMVSAWVTETIGQALTFDVAGYEAHKQKIAEFMGKTALDEFQAFMVTTNILNLMQSRNLELRAFVTDIPQLVTTGVTQGRYRWIYDIPVNLTFLPPGLTTYEGLGADQYRSEILTFRLQLGRVAEGGREGLMIETWEALKKKANTQP